MVPLMVRANGSHLFLDAARSRRRVSDSSGVGCVVTRRLVTFAGSCQSTYPSFGSCEEVPSISVAEAKERKARGAAQRMLPRGRWLIAWTRSCDARQRRRN